MMERSDIGKFLLGLGTLGLGVEIVFHWDYIYRLGGLGLLIMGVYLVSSSKEAWKDSVKDILPLRLGNLFRFPRLPYFQTVIMVLLFLASIFMILPSSYGGLLLVLLGLAISQFALNISEKNIKSEFRIMLVFQFQVFIFFSTFIYVNFQRSYLLRIGSEYISSIFLFFAWFAEFLYLYLKIFK